MFRTTLSEPLPEDKERETRVFQPLCGKTVDMIWLAEKGFQVVGVEAVEKPILEFFMENNICYGVKTLGTEGIKCYTSLDKSKDICIYQMDVFKVTQAILGGLFDAIWDRSSLTAIGLYVENRGHRYVDILSSLLRPNGRIMVENNIWFEDPGPDHCESPSHIPDATLKDLFGKTFDITPLDVEQSGLIKREKFSRVYHLMTLKTKQ